MRLEDLMERAAQYDENLARDIKDYVHGRKYGLVYEASKPEFVRMWKKPVVRGDIVNILPPRGVMEDTKNEDEIWVDSYEVCTFLQISDRTLQRLRAKGVVAFSNIGGRCYYKIGELKRLLEERLIKSNDECMRNLITNHELYAKERRNTKQDK